MTEDTAFLQETLLFLLAAVIVVPIFQRLRSSLVLGYLAAGVMIGPDVLGLVALSGPARHLAELGVVFLLFAVGLELTWERLWQNRSQMFGLGIAQVLVTTAAIAGAGLLVGLPLAAAVIVGGGLALSSTAVVIELLSERGELNTQRGRRAIAVLLMQDLAVVPMLALVSVISVEDGSAVPELLWTLGKAFLALVAVVFLGRLVLRPVFHVIAIGRNNELFVAVTLTLLLGMSFVTATLGLSLAMGGFLAGVLLAETEYRRQVAVDIRPFRGLLLGLFFMTVGIGLDLGVVADSLFEVCGIALGLMVIKSGTIFVLCRIGRIPGGRAVDTGLLLAGAGEFGFVIFALAGMQGLLDTYEVSVLAAAIAVSMVCTPFLAAFGSHFNARFDARHADRPEDIRAQTAELADHVIVVGFGRVGLSVAKALQSASIPYDGVDYDLHRVALAKSKGHQIFFGDAGQLGILEALGIARARAIVIMIDNRVAVEQIVHLIHRKFPDIEILVRARDTAHMEELAAAGAGTIVHETYELSLHLGEAVLRKFDVSEDRIHDILDAHRADDYQLLRG